jgi:hypothetical protein
MKTVLITVTAAAALLAGCDGTSAGTPGAPSPSATPAETARSRAPSAPARALAAGLAAGGLGIKHLIVYNSSTDPNHLLGRQGDYTSKVAWVDPAAIRAGAGNPADDRGGTEFGGGIEVFPDAATARSRYEELKGFKPPFGDGYDYLVGTAILRLSQFLTPAQARRYEAAFRQMAGLGRNPR